MANETFAPIDKPDVKDMDVKPNLDLVDSYENFNWDSMYE